MPFIALCDDNAGSEDLRRDHLAAHLAYVEQHQNRIAVAGPLGESPYHASLFIYDVDTLAAAESLLHHDPYYREGVYATTRIETFTAAIGTWVGGVQYGKH